MKQKTGRRIKRMLLLVTGLYFAGGIALYFFQDNLLFHPRGFPDYRYSVGLPYEELNIPFHGNNLNIIQFKSTIAKKGVVLFYHWQYE
jgi:hypothetical protein